MTLRIKPQITKYFLVLPSPCRLILLSFFSKAFLSQGMMGDVWEHQNPNSCMYLTASSNQSHSQEWAECVRMCVCSITRRPLWIQFYVETEKSNYETYNVKLGHHGWDTYCCSSCVSMCIFVCMHLMWDTAVHPVNPDWDVFLFLPRQSERDRLI